MPYGGWIPPDSVVPNGRIKFASEDGRTRWSRNYGSLIVRVRTVDRGVMKGMREMHYFSQRHMGSFIPLGYLLPDMNIWRPRSMPTPPAVDDAEMVFHRYVAAIRGQNRELAPTGIITAPYGRGVLRFKSLATACPWCDGSVARSYSLAPWLCSVCRYLPVDHWVDMQRRRNAARFNRSNRSSIIAQLDAARNEPWPRTTPAATTRISLEDLVNTTVNPTTMFDWYRAGAAAIDPRQFNNIIVTNTAQ